MDIVATIVATLLGFASVIVIIVTFRVIVAGPSRVSQLRRKRYGLAAWFSGGLPKTGIGTTVHELEGIEMKARNGRLVAVRQTRAPTSTVR
jgi:hypothetical protein